MKIMVGLEIRPAKNTPLEVFYLKINHLTSLSIETSRISQADGRNAGSQMESIGNQRRRRRDWRFGNVDSSFIFPRSTGLPDFGRISFKISVNYNPSNKPFLFKLSYATETPIDVTVQKLMLLQAKVL